MICLWVSSCSRVVGMVVMLLLAVVVDEEVEEALPGLTEEEEERRWCRSRCTWDWRWWAVGLMVFIWGTVEVRCGWALWEWG